AFHRRRRRHGDHLANTGDLRRNDVHQDRRRIGGAAAGYVDADTLERLDLLSEDEARAIAIPPALLHLPTMKVANAPGRETQRASRPGLELLFGGAELAARHLDRGADVDAIEPERVLDERLVAARAH